MRNSAKLPGNVELESWASKDFWHAMGAI